MLYILDTSAFSDLMRGEARTSKSLDNLSGSDRAAICPIVRGEILHGIERLPWGRRRSRLQRAADSLFELLACEHIPEVAADQYARIKYACETRGLSLDENDLWIASTAAALGARLVTRDADFRGVEGLDMTDWSTTGEAT